jgi:hypothetical protein
LFVCVPNSFKGGTKPFWFSLIFCSVLKRWI